MKYYAKYNENGELISFGASMHHVLGREISAEEYAALKEEARQVKGYTDRLVSGEMVEADVPEAFRARASRSAGDMLERLQNVQDRTDEIDDTEALNILLHGDAGEADEDGGVEA